MQFNMFRLVNPDNENQTFAVGIDFGNEAITYQGGKASSFGTHDSAEGAHRLFSRITPLRLVWEGREPNDPQV